MALAIDHRSQVEDDRGEGRRAARAHRSVQATGGQGRGADRQWQRRLRHAARRQAMAARRCSNAGDHGFWVARPVEVPGSRPLRLETDANGSLGAALNEWPVDHVAKVLAFYHPDDDAALKAEQQATLRGWRWPAGRSAASFWSRSSARRTVPSATTPWPAALRRLYAIGIKPDWWKLEGQPTAAAWAAVDAAIAQERSLLPRRRAARSRCAAAGAGGGVPPGQTAAGRLGASPSGVPSLARRRAAGSLASSTTRPRQR
jgi:5-dehydro-2-deoxygluconokinase